MKMVAVIISKEKSSSLSESSMDRGESWWCLLVSNPNTCEAGAG